MPVERSELITCLVEAREYYAAKLVGAHRVDCHGRPVTIHFEAHSTHAFSEETREAIAQSDLVRTRVPGGRVELRRFSLDRAKLLDDVLPAVAGFTVSIPGTSNSGAEKRMLHGTRLPDGRFLRVVLRSGPGDAFTCVTAYPVDQTVWLAAKRAKSARFPP